MHTRHQKKITSDTSPFILELTDRKTKTENKKKALTATAIECETLGKRLVNEAHHLDASLPVFTLNDTDLESRILMALQYLLIADAIPEMPNFKSENFLCCCAALLLLKTAKLMQHSLTLMQTQIERDTFIIDTHRVFKDCVTSFDEQRDAATETLIHQLMCRSRTENERATALFEFIEQPSPSTQQNVCNKMGYKTTQATRIANFLDHMLFTTSEADTSFPEQVSVMQHFSWNQGGSA